MSTRFDLDTGVVPLGDGAFAGRIDPGWRITRGPNGGYVAAIVLRALAACVEPDRASRSLTIHYTAPPEEGPVRVVTRVERAGRSLSTVSGRMLQGDRVLALALGAFSKPRAAAGFDQTLRPEAPPPEACPRFEGRTPMNARYDYRWAVGHPPFSGVEHSLAGGWIRSAEPRLADAALVAAFTDAWPPSHFARFRATETPASVPTVDLTIHFRRALPLAHATPDDFYLAVFRSRLLADGFLEEDGEIWSRDGQLLAQSRQLAVSG
jgi:acyl-CoA thioesterase